VSFCVKLLLVSQSGPGGRRRRAARGRRRGGRTRRGKLLGGARPWPWLGMGGTQEAEGTWRSESTADGCIGVAYLIHKPLPVHKCTNRIHDLQSQCKLQRGPPAHSLCRLCHFCETPRALPLPGEQAPQQSHTGGTRLTAAAAILASSPPPQTAALTISCAGVLVVHIEGAAISCAIIAAWMSCR
jgi:hypothetical protein